MGGTRLILRPLSNFTGNGVLRGTITSLDDLGEPLGWEAYGNWSDRTFLERSAKQLADSTGIQTDRARTLLTQAVKEARNLAGVPGSNDAAQESFHNLPVIIANQRHLRDVAADSWEVLKATNRVSPQFFLFGNSLCDLSTQESELRPRLLTPPSLRNRLDRLADYISIDKHGEEHPSRPQKDLLEDMLAEAGPPLPHLRGVVRGPVCRPDGSLAVSEGFDPVTELYLSLGSLQVPPVSDQPSLSDISRAKDLILFELLGDFPFPSIADKAHAVSEILTPAARPLISGPTPLHLNEAPTPGSGKDLLADCVALINTGGLPAAMTEGRDDDEWRKRLTAKLITSPSIVLIDNVKRRLDSGALSAALERPIWEDRLLGHSRVISVPIRCVWICTANNPAYSDEIARRIVRVRIDSELETPWERTGFKHPDLKGWVNAHRGLLLWAILTLIRAWAAQGKPTVDEVMGSFESWTNVIGGILKVAGIPGFLTNRDEVYAQVQVEGEPLRALVAVWWETYQGQRVGTDKLFDLAKEKRLLTDLRSGRQDHGARIALGRMLGTHRDRIIGDYRIRQAGTGHGGGLMWKLEIHHNVEIDPDLDSPHSPLSPTFRAGYGEYGDSGESFPGRVSEFLENNNALCGRCGAVAQGSTVTSQVDGRLLCPDCEGN